MTRIILESKNSEDVQLIKELAERLNIHYQIQSMPAVESSDKTREKNFTLINKIIDVSNYGDPTLWQKKVREDRNIKLS